jgi:hypothetical protein
LSKKNINKENDIVWRSKNIKTEGKQFPPLNYDPKDPHNSSMENNIFFPPI